MDFGRQDLDAHARPILAERFAHRFFAGVLGDRLVVALCGFVCVGPAPLRIGAAQSELENRERQLRVVLRQALRLLPQEPALELLVLFLKKMHQLLVLVALLLELRVGLRHVVEARLECVQALGEIAHRHDEHECKIAIALSSMTDRRTSLFYAARARRDSPASNLANAAPSTITDLPPADEAGSSNTARCSRLYRTHIPFFSNQRTLSRVARRFAKTKSAPPCTGSSPTRSRAACAMRSKP